MDSDFRPRKRLAERSSKIDIEEAKQTSVPETLPVIEAASGTSRWQRLRDKWPHGKKAWVVNALLLVVVGFSTGLAIAKHTPRHTVAADTKVAAAVKPKAKAPAPIYSTLSGLPADTAANSRPVTGVMIENSLQARPQAGLSQAGVVFEAIAEGGITRFLALFQDKTPDNIGPIRSARPYYVQWALGFDAGYAHVGGSPEALADIKQWQARDLDQFYNSGAYHRITQREAPHNVYTSVSALNSLEASKGYTSSTYTGFARKPDAPAKQPTAKSINFHLSGPLYDVHYDYHPTTNDYARSEGGAPHMDATSNAQLAPRVVIGLVMPYSLASDGYHSVYNTLGSGQAYVFQDGSVTIGSWKKTAANQQFSFSDANGKCILLNRGQTWLTALSSSTNASYAP